MVSHFAGHERLQLFFPSPNHAATVLAIVALLNIGLIATLYQNRSAKNSYNLLYPLTVGILCLVSVGIALTYSRGGWLAMFSGLAIASFCSPDFRAIAFRTLPIFALATIMPGFYHRLGSTSLSDDSVGNRLIVWGAAARMTVDNPISGVGSGNFGPIFKALYQPLEMKTSYFTAVNNYLTISSEQGLVGLLFLIFFVTFFFVLSVEHSLHFNNPWCAAIVGGQLVFLVSGFFTYNLTEWSVVPFYLALVFVVSISTCFYKEFWNFKFILKCLLISFAFALIIGLSVAAVGVFISSRANEHISNASIGSARVPCIRISFDSKNVASLFVVPGQDDNVFRIIRTLARPLSRMGVQVYVPTLPISGNFGLKQLNEGIHTLTGRDPTSPIILLGMGTGGGLAIVTAASTPIAGIISIGAESTSPFYVLSPISSIPRRETPVLLIHQSNDTFADVSEVYALFKHFKQFDVKVSLKIIQSDKLKRNESEQQILSAVANFCREIILKQ